jgi:hypothetical protein
VKVYHASFQTQTVLLFLIELFEDEVLHVIEKANEEVKLIRDRQAFGKGLNSF